MTSKAKFTPVGQSLSQSIFVIIEAANICLYKDRWKPVGNFQDQGAVIWELQSGFEETSFQCGYRSHIFTFYKGITQFIEHAWAQDVIPHILDTADVAGKNRVLLLKHGPTETDMDIALGMLVFEEEMVDSISWRLSFS